MISQQEIVDNITKSGVFKGHGDNAYLFTTVLYQLVKYADLDATKLLTQMNQSYIATAHESKLLPTDWIVRYTSDYYGNADRLEMSHDEILGMCEPVMQVNPGKLGVIDRQLIKFRGMYPSHPRNRVFLGINLAMWATLKLCAYGSLSFPWQALWAISVRLGRDMKDTSGIQLGFCLVETYRNQPFRSKMMTSAANKWIETVNARQGGLKQAMLEYWRSEHSPHYLLAPVVLPMIQ